MRPPSSYMKRVNTDKTQDFLQYGDIYDLIFLMLLALRNCQPIKVLEIGCSARENGSPKAFDEMPYVSQYLGIDKDVVQTQTSSKCHFVYGDAYSHEVVDEVRKYAPFDLIIDDGSHTPKDWHFFLNTYACLLYTSPSPRDS